MASSRQLFTVRGRCLVNCKSPSNATTKKPHWVMVLVGSPTKVTHRKHHDPLFDALESREKGERSRCSHLTSEFGPGSSPQAREKFYRILHTKTRSVS
jgi:hypothetical protein